MFFSLLFLVFLIDKAKGLQWVPNTSRFYLSGFGQATYCECQPAQTQISLATLFSRSNVKNEDFCPFKNDVILKLLLNFKFNSNFKNYITFK